MSGHDYTPEQALALLLHKLDASNADLAAQVRAAIDAGKDIDEEAQRRSGRKTSRRYRKAVRLSEEEALAVALDVLRAYFVEQPLFVSSAMDNARVAALGGPRDEYERKRVTQDARTHDAGSDVEKVLEIELRSETQLTSSGDETYRLHRRDESAVTEQRANVSRLRGLVQFGPE